MKMNKQIKWNINELDSENVEEYLIKLRGIWPQEFNFNEEIALNFIHEMKYKLPWQIYYSNILFKFIKEVK